jgi:hypothetical protein
MMQVVLRPAMLIILADRQVNIFWHKKRPLTAQNCALMVSLIGYNQRTSQDNASMLTLPAKLLPFNC